MSGIDSEELKAFVSSVVESVEEGLKGKKYHVSGSIEFEVAVANVKRAEGGLKLLVVDASGKYDKESASKIRFKVEKDRSPMQVSRV